MKLSRNNSILLLGGSGFIGQSILEACTLRGWGVRSVSSSHLDLTQQDASQRLIPMLHDVDVLIFTAAITPDRCCDWTSFSKSILMATGVIKALNPKLRLVVYISSDAVFSSDLPPISEGTLPCPDSLYGTMHLAREQMLQDACRAQEIPLLILRLCAVYGARDTHNSYGPNRFIRSALQNGHIELFGKGDDVRPHLFVNDFVSVLMRSIEFETMGLLHVIPETSYSFMHVAEIVRRKIGRPLEILLRPRASAASKKFYNAELIKDVFPDFSFTGLEEGIEHHVQMVMTT